MSEELSSFVSSLREARDLEGAAHETLRAMLSGAERFLKASRFSRNGRLLRGVVHLRPEDAYRRLVVLEHEAMRVGPRGAQAQPVAPGPNLALLASASAWRAVVKHGCAVSIDVTQGTLRPHLPTSSQEPAKAQPLPFTRDSQQRMLGRQATHVGAFPLRAPGGRLVGLVALEADCMAALGQEFVWEEAGSHLQLLADIAATYLLSLPPRPQAAPETDEFLPVVGSTMASLMTVLRVFAEQEETLLVSGPTGSGKSRLARWCHENSSRRQGPFEALDLNTVPEELQMAELFGWRKGAFTGAMRDNTGSVARAQGGTLFIDEVDKLSLKAQAGLLHILEERTYRPLGESSGEQRADVRFIIGTNVRLQDAVSRGAFREDLYYRINVLPVQLPPLEQRRDEIPLWARYMVSRRHQEKSPGGAATLSPEAEQVLMQQPWPGNLRQLDNIVRRAYTLAMVEQRGARDLELRETHVRQALAYDEKPSRSPWVEALCQAARVLVEELRGRNAPLDIDHVEAFRGFVLGVASEQLGREEAFRLLGRESLVRSRNHRRALRRELERVEALCRELGQPGPAFLAPLLAEADEGP